MQSTKVFKSGNSQAVRLPKSFQTTDTEFLIRKIGSSIILSPINDPWKPFEESLDDFSDDYLSQDRQQPPNIERESL